MDVYIETYGCQMNDDDSRTIGLLLTEAGHRIVDRPDGADAIIVNTCSVRRRAEQRAIGRLRHLAGLKKSSVVLGVAGCMAQRMAGELTRSVRGLDFVVGTDSYRQIPALVIQAREGRKRVEVEVDTGESYDAKPQPTSTGVAGQVSVMRGCNNYCSYCIVPYVRGRERSRPAVHIVDEVRALVQIGLRDVTLIGQNVNSYRDDGRGFPELLALIDASSEVERIRFATSHPKDLSRKLIQAVAALPKVCEHIHLPVQSGSDAILGGMNRSYRRQEYVDLVGRIRDEVPGVAVTTDVIVGFPGETEQDFECTVSLMEDIRFDSAFMFRYSPREGTGAALLEDDVSERNKIARLEQIIALQREITDEINKELVGQRLEILVEGPSKKDPFRLFGKTRTAKTVVFEGPTEIAGTLVRVSIKDASAWTLLGERDG